MKTLLLLSISSTIPKALGKHTTTTNQNNTPSNHCFQNAQTIRIQIPHPDTSAASDSISNYLHIVDFEEDNQYQSTNFDETQKHQNLLT
jgi:hypothetical protein